MSDLPLKATLKAGRDFDAPWLTVDGISPDDLKMKLQLVAEQGVLEALVDAATTLRAIHNLAAGGVTPPPAAAPSAPPAAPQQSGWGQQAPAQPQQQAAPQGGARLHPEGKTCPCGNVLNYKEVNRRSDGKLFKFWECPQRKGSKDTQHVSEFAN